MHFRHAGNLSTSDKYISLSLYIYICMHDCMYSEYSRECMYIKYIPEYSYIWSVNEYVYT